MISIFIFSIIMMVAGFGVFIGGLAVGAFGEGPMHVSRATILIKRGIFIALAGFTVMAASGVFLLAQNGVFG